MRDLHYVIADPKGSCIIESIEHNTFDFDRYPRSLESIHLPTSDLCQSQAFFANEKNFSSTTCFDVLHLNTDGSLHWLRNVADPYLNTSYPIGETFQIKTIKTRIVFLSLKEQNGASSDCRIPLTMSAARNMCEKLQVPPSFMNSMFGQYTGNHLPAAHFLSHDTAGNFLRQDLLWQQPRWGFRVRHWPISTWTSYDESSETATCIVSCASDDPRVLAVLKRLEHGFSAVGTLPSAISNAADPFLFQLLVAHESFMQADPGIFDLGNKLYSALDAVDATAHAAYDRDSLRSLTYKLHEVSQDVDSHMSSAENNIEGLRAIEAALQSLWSHSKSLHAGGSSQSHHNALYLRRAMEARRRWLYNAKSRKDTAISFVYNLVAQRDTEANIAIAREARNDSASMKTIAVLTMIFLPVSAVSSFFGTNFFRSSTNNGIQGAGWWLVFAVSIPLTMLVLLVWYLWQMRRVAVRDKETCESKLP